MILQCNVPVTFPITGYEEKELPDKGILLYEAGETDRTISVRDYPSLIGNILMFDKNGNLYEAGGGMIPNNDKYYGAQSKVTIPAGGFMIDFHGDASADLLNLYLEVMGDIMIYNATVSMTYPLKAVVDKTANTVTFLAGEPYPVTGKTVTFLFVGNSCTYFNGTPIKFEALCRAAGLDVKAYYCTFGSAALSEFADASHERGTAMREKLKQRKYDYVVLQDIYNATFEDSCRDLESILPLVKENGATPLLYMGYASTIRDNSTPYRIYVGLSEKFGLKTDYSAVAFADTFADNPEINLLAEDGDHHSKEGSYLIACGWLESYLGINPVGNSYTAGLKADVALKLQQEAHRAATDPQDPGDK